ncbi:MAG: VOC family protein [Verrucomicrobiaceae bacterium]|nr:VOC family protein [Verrucomicrobiaceae bacterium]
MKPEKVKFMLLAADMRRATAFYRDAIGLEEVFVSDFWTELRHGDAIIALHGGHDGQRNPTGLTFQFEDVLQKVDVLTQAGATVLQAPTQRPGDPVLLSILRDPEGNEFFATQYVG